MTGVGHSGLNPATRNVKFPRLPGVKEPNGPACGRRKLTPRRLLTRICKVFSVVQPGPPIFMVVADSAPDWSRPREFRASPGQGIRNGQFEVTLDRAFAT